MVRALLTHRYLIAAVFAGLLLQACGVARASEPHYFEPDGIGHNYVVVGGDTLSVSFLPTDESLRHGRLSEHDFEEVAAELGVEVAAIKAVTGKPIKFAGSGEKLQGLEVFHPDRMASRILGMGDVLSLIEEAEQRLDEKAAERTAQRMMQNKLDLNDMLEQFQQVKKMGPIKGILQKLPGIGGKLDDVDIDDRIMDRTAAIILSMTPYERSHPEELNASRKRRIAAGCGQKVEDVNRLLNQFRQTQKLMKQFGGKKGRKLMKGMGGMGGGMPF